MSKAGEGSLVGLSELRSCKPRICFPRASKLISDMLSPCFDLNTESLAGISSNDGGPNGMQTPKKANIGCLELVCCFNEVHVADADELLEVLDDDDEEDDEEEDEDEEDGDGYWDDGYEQEV